MTNDGYMVVRDREDRSPGDTGPIPEGKKLTKVLGSKPFPPKADNPKEGEVPTR